LYLLKKVMSRHRYTTSVVALLAIIVVSFSYISFYLYQNARKAEQRANETIKQLRGNGNQAFAMATEMAFLGFLRAWHADHPAEGMAAAACLTGECKERTAIQYLLDPNIAAVKEPVLRAALAKEKPWFLEFVLAEDSLHRGERLSALERCRKSYSLLASEPMSSLDPAQYIRDFLAARLRDLTNEAGGR
jgi:hypothetical protein